MPLLLTKTLRDLRHRALRSALTLLAIAIGVAGVAAISTTARNLALAQAAVYASASQADVIIGARDVSPLVRNVLERLNNVAAIEGRVYDFTTASPDKRAARWVDLRLIGVSDFAAMRVNQVDLVTGRFPGTGEVALDDSSRALLAVQLGDTLYFRHNAGEPARTLRVVGFTRTPAAIDAAILNQATAYAPSTEVRKAAGIIGDNRLLVRLLTPVRAADTVRKLEGALGQRGVGVSFSRIRDPALQEGARELAALLLLLALFSGLGALLSGLLVANTVAAIVTDEMRQIGVMKALGASRWRLTGAYLLSALALGAAGTTAGIPLGVVGGARLSRYLAARLGLDLPPFMLASRDLLVALVVGLGVPLAAAAVPAWRGASLPADRLLRSYGLTDAYHRHRLDRWLRPLGRYSSVMVMALRNAGRRPVRSVITIVAIATGVAVFLATSTLDRSVVGTVDRLYGIYAADAYVAFARPVAPSFAAQLASLPDIRSAEAWSRVGGYVATDAVDVWGLPADTRLYRHQLIAGRWLSGAPREVVITGVLARKRGIVPGQVIEADVGRERRPLTVVGIVDDESTYLGSTATGKLFLTVADVSRWTYSGSNASFFALALWRAEPAAVDQALGRIELATAAHAPRTFAAYSDKASTLRAIRILEVLLQAMVALVGLIGAAGMANTLVLSVTERRHEIGILRAIGAGAGHIARLLLYEGLALGTVGLGLGLLVGVPLARELVGQTGAALFRLEFILSRANLVSTVFLTVLLTAVASLGPGLLATRLRPITTLRYE